MTREEAIKVLRTESIELGGSATSVCRFWEALDMAVKALDAVPVVRCRECKYLEKDDGLKYGRMCLKLGNSSLCHDDDFCSYGERKEGAD